MLRQILLYYDLLLPIKGLDAYQWVVLSYLSHSRSHQSRHEVSLKKKNSDMEFRSSFELYHPVFPKKPKRAFFWDTLFTEINTEKKSPLTNLQTRYKLNRLISRDLQHVNLKSLFFCE